MAIETSPRPVESLRIEVLATADRLGDIRRQLIAWLAPIGLSDATAADIVLVVNEAATNCVEHAYRGAETGRIRIEADVEGRRLEVRIADFGNWRAASSEPNTRGRGLPIMHAVSQRVEFDSSSHGTTVCIVFDLADEPIQD